MIRLNDNWIIDVDNDVYLLARETGRIRVERNGKESPERKVYGWYGSLKKALLAYGNLLNVNSVKNGEFTLEEALNMFDANYKKIEDLIGEHVKG